MADEVFLFASTDTNAPVLTGQVGKLVDLLTACLVDGYATVSVTSITRSGTTATVTTGSSHGLVTGQMATIAGAVESDYNGRYIVTVTSSTVFTYTVANSPTTPATGTITSRRASAGWTLPYSGTQKAVYRSANGASQQHYFRVLDSGGTAGAAKEAAVRAYVSMSDVDTGSEPFPTVAQATNGLFVAKSGTANSTARAWGVWANDKTVYIWIHNGTTWGFFGFGHFDSWKAGDAYNSFLSASATTNSVTGSGVSSGVGCGHGLGATSIASAGRIYVPRATNQTGTSLICHTYSTGNTSNSAGSTHGSGGSNSFSMAGSSANADGGTYVVPIYIMELGAGSGLNFARGTLPGLYGPLHAYSSGLVGTTVNGVSGLSGRTLYGRGVDASSTVASDLTGMVYIDITGPW